MPSRAEARAFAPGPAAEAPDRYGGFGARRAVEWALRLLALGLLALLLWRSLHPTVGIESARAAGGDLREALARWTARPPDAASLALERLPSPEERDWAAALRRAGVRLAWTGDSLPALAVETAPVADPAGGTRLFVAAPRGRVAVRDAVGPIDSLAVRGAGAAATFGGASGALVAEVPRGAASAVVPDSVPLRPVLVLGRAGWEAKFVLAALEERGWRADARLRVAPGVVVTQGAPAAPDTARYAAVVALDSAAVAEAAAIARFVRAGGGLVLGGEAARLPAFASVAAGAVGARASGILGGLAGDEPRRGLPLYPIGRLAPGAVLLERRDSLGAVAARRVALGRVIQLGYDETWRWRMAGEGDALDRHRAWWSRLVAGVARAPAGRPADSSGAVRSDPAPRAALAAALGAPGGAAGRSGAGDSRDPFGVATFLVLVALLLLEWGSRRARGAR